MDISRYISELLFEYECVIIPGFGGFVCSYSPAKIHPVQHTFNPPSKSMLFNPQLKTNDGLLANHIAIAEQITYDQALRRIDEFVDEVLITINGGGQASLEKIGVIYADQEGNLQFNQDTKNNFLKDSFGLSSFISPKINRAYPKSARKPETHFADRKGQSNRKKSVVLTNWVLAVAPIMLILGYFYFNTDVFDSGLQNKTSFVPDFTGENISRQMPSKPEISNDLTASSEDQKAKDESFNIAQYQSSKSGGPELAEIEKRNETPEVLPENKADVTKNIAVVNTEKTAPPLIPAGKMYYLIGGSFEKVENADKLIARYSEKGFKPQIIGQASNGYYRVSLMAYLRKEEALTELRKLRENEIPEAWVLRQ